MAISRREHFSARQRTLFVFASMFSATFANNVVSPLYVIYEQRYSLSSLVVTALSATYAAGVLVTLLLSGGLSDRVGRRPLLITGSVLVLGSTGAFLIATGAPMLFVGRALLGIATGVLTSSGAAALVELDRDRDRRRASVLTILALLGGTAAGPLAAGLIAQYLPDPTRTPYLIELALQVAALLGCLLLAEPATHHLEGFRFKVQRLSVPREIRARFLVAGVAAAAGWMTGGIYAALSGTIDRKLLHVTSHALAGLVLFLFAFIGGTSQLLARPLAIRDTIRAGVSGSALGVGLLAIALVVASPALFVVATVVAGLGNGLSYIGSMALVNEMTPHHRRGGILAAYNLFMYGSLVLPVVGLGALADHIGLESGTVVFAAVLVILCLADLIALHRVVTPVAARAVVLESLSD